MMAAFLHRWYLGDSTPAAGRLKFLLATAIALAAALTWVVRYDTAFSLLVYPDAHDYAQMGRQLYRGEGFSSLQTFPYVLAWLREHNHSTQPPWPNVTRFPLITLTNAAAYQLVGVGDLGAVLPCGIFLVLTSLVVFLLGNKLFGPLAGVVAAFLSFTGAAQLHYSLSGLAETGAGFFTAASALALSAVGGVHRRPLPRVFVLGVVLGLGFLQRYNLLLLVPSAALVLLIGPERCGLRTAIVSCLVFLATVSAWLIRDVLSFGSPLVSLTADRNLLSALIGRDLFYDFKQYDKWRVVIENFDVILAQIKSGWLIHHWRDLFGPGFAWLGPLFLARGLCPASQPIRSVWLFGFSGFVLTAISVSATYSEARFYQPFTALFLTLVVGSAVQLLRHLPRGLHIVIPTAALAVMVTFWTQVFGGTSYHSLERPASLPFCTALGKVVKPGGVVASDASWKVAWYCDRPSVRFRGDPGQLAKLDTDYFPIVAILLKAGAASRFRSAIGRSAVGDQFREALRFRDGAAVWVRRSLTRAPQ